MQSGLCCFFRGRGTIGFSLLSPAAEVELNCYVTLKAPWEYKVLFPLQMAVKPSQCSKLPLSLHVHSKQPGLLACRALYHHKHTTAFGSSSHGGKDRIFSPWEMERAAQGGWQHDQNYMKNLCRSTALKAHVLGQVIQDWRIPCPSALLPPNYWLRRNLWQPEHGFAWILLRLRIGVGPSRLVMGMVFTGFTG